MISQKESSTEYNPFVVPTRNDVLDAMSYVNASAIDYYKRQEVSLSQEIIYLKDMVKMLHYEVRELKKIVKEKSIVLEDSCEEMYAEDWRET